MDLNLKPRTAARVAAAGLTLLIVAAAWAFGPLAVAIAGVLLLAAGLFAPTRTAT